MSECSLVVVNIAIAISENGHVLCCVVDENNIQQRTNYKNWLDTLRKDSCLWSLKYVKTTVMYPVQYEEIL